MKKLSFYWNWLARVAQSNSVQRKAVVKSATPQSSIIGKTAILTVATIIAVALTTQITGTLAQSLRIPELPDLPDPGPAPEPVFPPVPPGTFTCSEYFASIRPGLDDQDANLKKAIERTYYAKRKPFYDALDAIFDEQDKIFEQIEKLEDEWRNLYMSPNSNSASNIARRKQINKELDVKRLEIRELQKKIDEIYKRLVEIEDWYGKMLEWSREKYEKAVDALEQLTRDCLDNETDDD